MNVHDKDTLDASFKFVDRTTHGMWCTFEISTISDTQMEQLRLAHDVNNSTDV